MTYAARETVSTPKSNQLFPAELDRNTYKWQHLFENFLGK